MAFLVFAPSVAVADQSDVDRGMSLLERGTELILEGLLSQVGPEIEELLGTIDELRGYHPPEMLPNGDIIIRRRQPGDGAVAPEDGTGDVEL